MKKKVKYGALCMAMTAIVFAALGTAIYCLWGSKDMWIIILISLAIVLGGLKYCPLSVETGKEGVILHRPFGPKTFRYDDIASVETCRPSPGGLRVFGSGGFMGFWGYFNDITIGNYFGYYAMLSQCFLITTKEGQKYVLSCQDRDEMVKAIGKAISASK